MNLLPRHPLARDIVFALAVKLTLLTGLYYAFFNKSHQQHPDEKGVATHLIGTP